MSHRACPFFFALDRHSRNVYLGESFPGSARYGGCFEIVKERIFMSYRWFAVFPVLVLALGCQGRSAGKIELKSQKEKVSYTIGQDIGGTLKKQTVEVDLEVLAKGIKDAYTGSKPLLTEAQVKETMELFQKEMMAKQEAMVKKAGEESAKAGEAFLSGNRGKEGVVTLPSGLQYKIIKAGTGKIPTAGDTVSAHYRGTLVDGKEFDSSYRRGEPNSFGVSEVIPAWQEALQLMPVGSKWQLYVPAKLGYGERGSGPIPPNSTLIFDIELVAIK
jgi:FKBP-type peptidyl-prolyl cis-trans isomerase